MPFHGPSAGKQPAPATTPLSGLTQTQVDARVNAIVSAKIPVVGSTSLYGWTGLSWDAGNLIGLVRKQNLDEIFEHFHLRTLNWAYDSASSDATKTERTASIVHSTAINDTVTKEGFPRPTMVMALDIDSTTASRFTITLMEQGSSDVLDTFTRSIEAGTDKHTIVVFDHVPRNTQVKLVAEAGEGTVKALHGIFAVEHYSFTGLVDTPDSWVGSKSGQYLRVGDDAHSVDLRNPEPHYDWKLHADNSSAKGGEFYNGNLWVLDVSRDLFVYRPDGKLEQRFTLDFNTTPQVVPESFTFINNRIWVGEITGKVHSFRIPAITYADTIDTLVATGASINTNMNPLNAIGGKTGTYRLICTGTANGTDRRVYEYSTLSSSIAGQWTMSLTGETTRSIAYTNGRYYFFGAKKSHWHQASALGTNEAYITTTDDQRLWAFQDDAHLWSIATSDEGAHVWDPGNYDELESGHIRDASTVAKGLAQLASEDDVDYKKATHSKDGVVTAHTLNKWGDDLKLTDPTSTGPATAIEDAVMNAYFNTEHWDGEHHPGVNWQTIGPNRMGRAPFPSGALELITDGKTMYVAGQLSYLMKTSPLYGDHLTNFSTRIIPSLVNGRYVYFNGHIRYMPDPGDSLTSNSGRLAWARTDRTSRGWSTTGRVSTSQTGQDILFGNFKDEDLYLIDQGKFEIFRVDFNGANSTTTDMNASKYFGLTEAQYSGSKTYKAPFWKGAVMYRGHFWILDTANRVWVRLSDDNGDFTVTPDPANVVHITLTEAQLKSIWNIAPWGGSVYGFYGSGLNRYLVRFRGEY